MIPDAVPASDRAVAEGLLPHEPLVISPTALETLTRSELDVQITTARRYPRSLAHFKAAALSMIRLDQATAASCFYALPRREKQDDGTWKKKTITGPSIRLAEIVASCWGNLRAGARVIAETQHEVVAHGYCHDLETNYAVATETHRRLLDRNGRRYTEDVVILTANAACAIARRNATFAVVPRAFVNDLVAIAMKVAAGEAKTLRESRERALVAFAELGVSADRVLEKLDRAGIEDLDLEDLAVLHGLVTAIRDGETTVAQEFPAPPAAEGGAAPSATAALTERLRRRRREAKGDPAQSEPPPAAAPSDPTTKEEPQT
jgi:hypothetical protein